MSSRSKVEIEQEYVKTCQELGETEFRATIVKVELTRLSDAKNNLTQKLRSLSKEHSNVSEASAVAPVVPEAVDGQPS